MYSGRKHMTSCLYFECLLCNDIVYIHFTNFNLMLVLDQSSHLHNEHNANFILK